MIEIRKIATFIHAMVLVSLTAFAQVDVSPVVDLIDRIGGNGASGRFVIDVDPTIDADGSEAFLITSCHGKPCIKGSTISALTTGIGWYLNHTANINLSWNNQ